MITVLKSKIHRAVVTSTSIHYEGSITIDERLLEEANIRSYEQVDVLNIHNGERFTTYAIPGEAGKGEIVINGAAARLVHEGDMVIICAYQHVDPDVLSKQYKPVVVLVDQHNKKK